MVALRILNLEPSDYSPKAQAILAENFAVDNGPYTRAELINIIKDYDAIIVRLNHHIDDEILAAANKLKVIVTATTGLNHIDIEAANRRNIDILSLREEREFLDTIRATTEHTFALMLALIRRIPAAHADVLTGNWRRDEFKGIELSGRKLGVYGYGRLGAQVARLGLAFGMRVLVHDVGEVKTSDQIKLVSREDLLKLSDIISLHVSYNKQNDKLINKEAFSMMKPGVLFINTARGELVDEEALLNVLQRGHMAGAAIDVVQGENRDITPWVIHDPLVSYARHHSNLIITPHTGGATYDSMEKTEIFMAEKLRRWYQSQS